MTAPGRFVISFDCEGKWGMADHLTPALEQLLTTRSIETNYQRILGALARTDTKATFAFVGAFTLSPDEYPAYADRLQDASVGGVSWLEPFRRDAAGGHFDGWFAPHAIPMVRQAGRHEIATHGFTHVPLAESVVDAGLFDHEMEQACLLAQRQGWVPLTIIYPRNQVGHAARLAKYGIVGYREFLWPRWGGAPRRVISLLAELGLAFGSQPVVAGKSPVRIPAGHILNFWHNRSRRLISRKRTVARWRSMLWHAAETGGVAHIWSHPHNFLSDPGLLPVFEEILSEANALVREGRLVNQTQIEYCRAQGA